VRRQTKKLTEEEAARIGEYYQDKVAAYNEQMLDVSHDSKHNLIDEFIVRLEDEIY